MRAARALGQAATRSPLLARARPVARGWARAEMRVASPFSTIPVGAKPTIEDAKTMPREYYEMPNDVLLTLAASGDYGAKEEIMIREIMAVDGVSWQDAQPKFQEISAKAYEGKGVATLPYKIGIAAALSAGFASIPLCFNLSVAQSFNELFVTTDIPEPRDLETWLEVGSWTWGWMEPPLGTISFFLLCLQYARDQKINIGQKPWTTYWREKQGDMLAAAYPQYHKQIVRDYGKETCFEDDSDDF